MIYKYGKRFRFAPSFNKHRGDQVIQIGMSAFCPSLWPREGIPLILQSIRWCWRSPVFCVKFTVTDITAQKSSLSHSSTLGTIHLRCRQIFTIYDPYPPTIGIPAKCLWRGFFILMYCDLLTIGTWGHPFPPKTCWRLKWMVPYLSLPLSKTQ